MCLAMPPFPEHLDAYIYMQAYMGAGRDSQCIDVDSHWECRECTTRDGGSDMGRDGQWGKAAQAVGVL